MNLHRLELFSLSLFQPGWAQRRHCKGAVSAPLAAGAASKRITDLAAVVGTVRLERHSRGVTLTVDRAVAQRRHHLTNPQQSSDPTAMSTAPETPISPSALKGVRVIVAVVKASKVEAD